MRTNEPLVIANHFHQCFSDLEPSMFGCSVVWVVCGVASPVVIRDRAGLD